MKRRSINVIQIYLNQYCCNILSHFDFIYCCLMRCSGKMAASSRNQVHQQTFICPSQKGFTTAVQSAPNNAFKSLYANNRPDMDKAEVRRQTFVFYPCWSEADVNELVDAGFRFTGDDDTTECFCCNLQVSNWKRGDNPMEVHRRRSPSCPFVTAHGRSHPSRNSPSRSTARSLSNTDQDCIDGIAGASLQSDGESEESEDEMDGCSDECSSRERRISDAVESKSTERLQSSCRTANVVDKRKHGNKIGKEMYKLRSDAWNDLITLIVFKA